MHPFDAASFLSATLAEGSFETRQQQEELAGAGAASPLSRSTRAGGENAGVRCQDCRRHRANAYCAHCCSDRGFVCPGHVKTTTSHVPASQQCSSERQQTTTTLAASASTAAVDVDVQPIPKRPRRTALPSAAAAPTTTSSVDQPIATAAAALERFPREVRSVAVFRRVQLGGPEAPEVAYYTTVTIAGHVFRGVLYDVSPHPHSGSSTAPASDTDGSGVDEVGSSLSTASGGCCLDLTLGL